MEDSLSSIVMQRDYSLEAIRIDSPVALPYSKACLYLHSVVPVTHSDVQ